MSLNRYTFRHRFDNLEVLDENWPAQAESAVTFRVLGHYRSIEFTTAFFCVPQNKDCRRVKSVAFILVDSHSQKHDNIQAEFIFLDHRSQPNMNAENEPMENQQDTVETNEHPSLLRRRSDSCRQSPQDGPRRFHCAQFVLDVAADCPCDALRSCGLLPKGKQNSSSSFDMLVRLTIPGEETPNFELSCMTITSCSIDTEPTQLPTYEQVIKSDDRLFPLAMFQCIDKPTEQWNSANFLLVSSDSQEFRVHAEVLKPYAFFRAFFERPSADGLVEQTSHAMHFEDINGDTLREVLRYCYLHCQPINMQQRLIELIKAADYFAIDELVMVCEQFIISNCRQKSFDQIELLIECDRYRLVSGRDAVLCALNADWLNILEETDTFNRLMHYGQSNIDAHCTLIQVVVRFFAQTKDIIEMGDLEAAMERRLLEATAPIHVLVQ